MPWSGKSFAQKHNRSLHGAAANKAASIATAMVNRGVDEGIAIATANKRAKSVAHKANHLARRGTISNKQHDKLSAKYKPASAGDTDDIKSKTSME